MAEPRAAVGNVAQNRALTEMAMGYSRSRILCAAARLGLADDLDDDPRSVDQLAVWCGAQPGSLYRLEAKSVAQPNGRASWAVPRLSADASSPFPVNWSRSSRQPSAPPWAHRNIHRRDPVVNGC